MNTKAQDKLHRINSAADAAGFTAHYTAPGNGSAWGTVHGAAMLLDGKALPANMDATDPAAQGAVMASFHIRVNAVTGTNSQPFVQVNGEGTKLTGVAPLVDWMLSKIAR